MGMETDISQSKHDTYRQFSDTWKRIRDAFAGPDAIKRGGRRYLPGLSGRPNDYENYLGRADFVEATSRSAFSMLGLAFRKPPRVVIPETMVDAMRHVGPNGESLEKLMVQATLETILMGRVGLMVDYPDGDETARPTISIYRTEALPNWDDAVGGPEWVILEEDWDEPGPQDHPWDTIRAKQYRLLAMDAAGNYYQQLYRPAQGAMGGSEKRYVPSGPPRYILSYGAPVRAIPLVGIGNMDLGLIPGKSLMQPIVDLNISLYRTSADLEWGRHFTSLATPYVVGYQDDKQTITLGSTSFLQFPQPRTQCEVGMLEFTGAGLGSLSEAVTQKQGQLAAMGARQLVPPKREAETAEALRLASASEMATLHNVVDSVSRGFQQTLYTWATWELQNDPESIEVEINRDFLETEIPPAMMATMGEHVLTELLPIEAYWRKLRDGEIIPSEWTDDRIQELIDAGKAVRMRSGLEGGGATAPGSEV